VVDSAASRKQILEAAPIRVLTRHSLFILFDSNLDFDALQYKNTAVWVDLVGVDPLLEVEADTMLASIGPVLHSTVHSTCSRFRNIQGLVLVD
jgi:hypothetical protein